MRRKRENRRRELVAVRQAAAAGTLMILLLSGSANGCDAGSSSITLGPGKHTVTKTLRGVWKAENAAKGCRWTVATKKGDVINSGTWKLSNREQHVLLGTGNIGMVFWPNNACGSWHR